MGEFSPEFLQKLVEALDRAKVDYIVIGGRAVAEDIPVYTQDLDVFVALRDFDSAVAKLREEGTFGAPEKLRWIAKFEVSYGEWHDEHSDVDVLNGRSYEGDLETDAFFDYIRDHWTKPGELGLTAQPPVVWYMRLLAGSQWKTYAEKILRDIGAGAPKEDWFDGVRQIAERTGESDRIGKRITYVEGLLKSDESPGDHGRTPDRK